VEKIWLVNYVVISKVSFVVVGLFLTHLHCDNSCDMFFCQTDVSNWCAQPEEPNISIKSGLCDGQPHTWRFCFQWTHASI